MPWVKDFDFAVFLFSPAVDLLFDYRLPEHISLQIINPNKGRHIMKTPKKNGIENLMDRLNNVIAEKTIAGLLAHACEKAQITNQDIYRIFLQSTQSEWHQILSATEGCKRLAGLFSKLDSKQAQGFFKYTVEVAKERFELEQDKDGEEDFFLKLDTFIRPDSTIADMAMVKI